MFGIILCSIEFIPQPVQNRFIIPAPTINHIMHPVFKQLHPDIRKALIKHGFTEPTEPQIKAIPPILEKKNVLLVAPTGSGKTESVALPVFHHILQKKQRIGMSALYITPLRALNRDMLSRLKWWGKELGIDVQVRHGDTSQYERSKQAKNPPDFLITTPETLQNLLIGSRLRKHLRDVDVVVVDEVHELAASKRGSQLSIALERLVEVSGEFQRIGLSATIGSPEIVASFLAGSDRDISIVDASMDAHTIECRVIYPQPSSEDCEVAKKLFCDPLIASHLRTIREIVQKNKSTLIFVNTREAAEILGSRFKMLDVPIGVHHGSLSVHARVQAEDAFKSGEIRGLICTSSMELGIDIGDVDHVIQYGSPRQVSRLIQRIGRAGHRIGEVSSGTVIAVNTDDIIESCAIIEKAGNYEIESIDPHEKPTDVLANQICGMVLDFGDIPLPRLLSIVRRSYPFRKIDPEELLDVVSEISEHWLIWHDGDAIKRRSKALHYYYQNLSMIPDEKRYDVYDIVSGRSIGALDEVFVVGFARPGAVFITKGEMWRIIELGERIKVEPIRDPQGEIPNWIGEEIPVPYDVAQSVGRIRMEIAGMINDGGEEDAVREFMDAYPVDEDAARAIVSLIRRQLSSNIVPDGRMITIEFSDGRSIMINACFGHKTNETIGRVIISLLAARFGSSVGMEVDPYRIKLTLPERIPLSRIRQILMDILPEYAEPIIRITLKNTTLLKWKVVQVARKFGALSRDIDYGRISMRKLLDIYEDTPMSEEAVREIMHDKLDIACAESVFDLIRGSEIEIEIDSASPMGRAGFSGGRELLSPDRADRSILLMLKNRIMNDRVILFCVNCQKWVSRRKVKNVPDIPECPLCGSRMIAALKPWEDEEIKIVQKRRDEEKNRAKRVYKNANLVLSHGKAAVIALASRGVGPDAASRIIRKLRRSEDEFYADIFDAERNYVRTKRFWD